jgi:protein involved in polysaccharide export with SLBB domain
VAKGLSKILRSPNVVVKIVDRSGRAQTRLEGAVRTPMRFSLLRAVHLRELLVIAGGLTDAASGDISVLRQPRLGCDREGSKDGKDNGLRTINIKISELLSGKTGSDPTILSGDIIRVERALPIYVIGAVAKPGPLFVRSGMNLSQAIAAAGGLAKNAAGQQVKLFRREGRETRIIEADLARIKVDASKDPVLAPFDIIEVATRGGSPRKYPPVIAMPEAGDQGKVEPRLRIID